MSDAPRLSAVSAFDGLMPPAAPEAKVRVEDLDGLGLATVVVRNGKRQALAASLKRARGLALAAGPKLSKGKGLTLAGIGPDAWLAFGEDADGTFAADLKEAIQDAASVADQGSGYGMLRIGGEAAETCLARMVPVDLHPSVFPAGSVASTTIAHMSVILWRAGPSTFELAVFRSFAASLMHELAQAARAFGFGAADPRG